MEISFHKADLIGSCDECGEPATGDFDSDRDGDDDGRCFANLKCVSCGKKQAFEIDTSISATELVVVP
jgi:hypothetical protein